MAALWLTALVNGSLAGIALTLLAWLAVRAATRSSAATRYGIWWTAFVLTAALPVLSYFRLGLPAQRVSVPSAELAVFANPPILSNQSEQVPGTQMEPIAATLRPPVESSARQQRLPLAFSTTRQSPVWLALAWGFAVLLGCARLVREAILLRRFRQRCAQPGRDLQARMDRFVQGTSTRRRARLVLSNEIRGPLAFGFSRPVIALPTALVEQLSEPELDKILLHELAHLRRCDDWARLLQRIVETFFFFHPALIWLGRKLDLEREIACDDWVIAVTGQAREYASCLTRVVELAGFRRGWALATGAAEKRSHLIRRIELMLDKTRNRTPHASRLALLMVGVAAVLAATGAGRLPSVFAFTIGSDQDEAPPPPPMPPLPAPVARPSRIAPVPPPAPRALAAFAPATVPAPPAPPAPPAAMASPAPPAPPAPEPESRNWSATWRENGRSLELRVDGEVEFSDDDRDVKRLSPNGRFLIEASGGGPTKRYEVRADSNGNLTRIYTVDGRQRGLDEAKPWLAGTLPEVIRETAAGAGERIQRIAQRGGGPAAIREIGLIRNDHSKRVYVHELVDRVHLNDRELSETMRLVRTIGSDGEKTQVLIAVAPKYLKAGLREPFFEAVDTLHSDGEHRRALISVAQSDPGEETATLASRSAARINSDGEKASALIQIARANMGDESARAWMKAVATIHSDGEKRRALTAMLAADGRPATIAAILRVASAINADGEKANLLIQAAGMSADWDLLRKPFFEAANSLHSDGEHARVLLAVLDRDPSPATIAEVARSARHINSDGEKNRVLLRIARENLNDTSILSGFFEALDSISSDGEHARSLLVVAGKSSLPDQLVIAVVRSAEKIKSDGEKARVLLFVAQNYGRNRIVGQEIRSAAKSISSSGEYGRVIRALERESPAI